MTRHSPQIRLTAARVALRIAREECAHWDFESEPEPGRKCCNALLDALHEVRLARAALHKLSNGDCAS